MKATKKVLGCLSLTALAVVLAAPVSAQSLALKASVPFDFVVGGHTLPAGDYLFSIVNNLGVLAIRNESTDATPTFNIISIAASGPLDSAGGSVTFHRYGRDYFLAKIWDGDMPAGRSIPTSNAEQERAKSASLRKPEVVMVLARR